MLGKYSTDFRKMRMFLLQIFIAVNGQILENNLAIWSHWLISQTHPHVDVFEDGRRVGVVVPSEGRVLDNDRICFRFLVAHFLRILDQNIRLDQGYSRSYKGEPRYQHVGQWLWLSCQIRSVASNPVEKT